MRKALFKAWASASDAFWIVPGALVCAAILAAIGLIEIDKRGLLPEALIQNAWLYDGGGTGARTLLGAVASSAIGVAGTVFSITIAALTLAAGQMGPRLLRNFTRDRGNQVTLGAFLATFSYALMVLRSVRTQDEGTFVPRLALSVGILLAFACVGMLVYFVGHMASRINVDTVIDMVSEDVRASIQRLTIEAGDPAPPVPAPAFWSGAVPVCDPRRGYLQHLDEAALSEWARDNGVSVRLLVRPGSYVFPGAPVACVQSHGGQVDPAAAGEAIRSATALGSARVSASDLEYSIRQLVEVAVRALSPGINDPHTAISVLDRLGSSLCDLASRELPNGVWMEGEDVCLVVPAVDYDGLTDAMFHMIRQNGAGSPAVLIRLMEVLVAVASCEPRGERRAILARHARLVVEDARRTIGNPSDLGDLEQSLAGFQAPVSASDPA